MTRFRAECDCGWSGTYASEARAHQALQRHSCQRQQRKAEARARDEARRAAVDRTPRPCLHTRVQHEHGTHACYVSDRCHCIDCSAANAAYEANRARQIAYGRWRGLVDAEPARAHVRALMAAGVGLKQVAKLSGIAPGSLWKLVYGAPQADGDTRRSSRIRGTTETRLLAVTPDLPSYADGAIVDATGTRRRLQALVAIGWAQAQLARRLGMTPANLSAIMRRAQVLAATARKVQVLYGELSMSLPPDETPHQRASSSRARGYAEARRWPPPLAWDDDAIDDPAAKAVGTRRPSPDSAGGGRYAGLWTNAELRKGIA